MSFLIFGRDETILSMMSERFSRRRMLRWLALGVEAVAGSMVSKGKVGRFLMGGQVQEYSTDINWPALFEETPPVAVVAPPSLEESPKPEILLKPSWSKEVLLRPVRQGPSDRPLVGLTIDDGFLARNEVLDSLIAKGVKATFFIIGRVAVTDPDFIRKACDFGFEFGNHTYSHSDLTRMTTVQMKADIQRCEDVLTGIDERAKPIPYLRPPGGARNSLTDQAGTSLGYRSIIWNVSGDAGANYTPEQLGRLYLNDQFYKSGNPWGSIMLIHFNARTAAALGPIIDGIRGLGMEPVQLSKLYEGGRV